MPQKEKRPERLKESGFLYGGKFQRIGINDYHLNDRSYSLKRFYYYKNK